MAMEAEEVMEFREVRDTPHVPEDTGEYLEDIKDILNRIPVGWGKWISCGPGWYKLLADTNRKMKLMCPTYEIHQVKEKFGTLRFYWGIPFEDAAWEELDDDTANIVYDIMGDIAGHAENQSAYICESCGKYGKIRDGGWVRTLCTACAIEQNYPLDEWEKKP
jgi:hypothetical protein